MIIIYLLAAIGSIIIIFCFGIVIDHYIDKFYYIRYKQIKQEIDNVWNHKLLQDSYWFSEHEPTIFLLQELAKNENINQTRIEWREKMKALNDKR